MNWHMRGARPHGWGANEILRAMQEDSRRFRRPGKPTSDGANAEWDDQADTIRSPQRHEP